MNSRDSDQSVLPSPSGPVLCATGCGFFGNPNTDNLCSKCNNDRKRQAAAEAAAASSSSPATATVSTSSTTATMTATTTPSPALVSTSSPATSTSSPATPTLAPLAISESAVSSTSSPAVDAAAILSPAPSSTATAAAAATSSPTDAPTSTVTPKKKLNRCGICSKKVGITYFNCRCDDTLLLCSAHRLPHQHDCKFDLKKLHTANLTKANPEIVKAKMEKI